MSKKLITISTILVCILNVVFVEAQKVGNGGNFNTAQARRVLNKISLFLDFTVFSEASGVDRAKLANTKDIYDLNNLVYPGIGQKLVLTGTLNDHNDLCLIGSTQAIATLLTETDNQKVWSFISQNLKRIEQLPQDERTQVLREIKRGVSDKFVGEHCDLQ